MTPLNEVASTPQPTDASKGADNLREIVLSVIAEVTRYPRHILQPEADLEEELGIDSVKRAEILAVLKSRFNLAESEESVPDLRTIADVIEAVHRYAGAGVTTPIGAGQAPGNGNVSSVPERAHGSTSVDRAGVDHGVEQRVIDSIAEITRFPKDILVPGADLDEDLGFDHAQRSSIVDALRRQFSIRVPVDDLLPDVRTIADIVATVIRLSAAPDAWAGSEPVSTASPSSRVQMHQAQAVSPKPFAGRVALVTGSGHGLGKVIARQLAQQGATVVVNSFHARQKGDECANQIVAEGGQAVHLWGSVAKPEHLDRIFGEIGDRFGGLDFFVSNASNGVFARLADVRAEDWDKAFRTNVIALHRGSLLAAELMRKQGGGKIVALSANASQRYVDYFGCMGPIKAAVESLVRYLAIELGGDNIQVNAVAAGPVVGELLDRYPEGDRLRPIWEATVPRRRMNDEEEVAEAVRFLLTTSGMNGSIMLVDAGFGQRIMAAPG